jgi:hypothetical protein
MSEPRIVELWPCGYVAKCSARECRRRATTILRYLDNQGRPDHPVCKLCLAGPSSSSPTSFTAIARPTPLIVHTS